jgi:hypothetical protein
MQYIYSKYWTFILLFMVERLSRLFILFPLATYEEAVAQKIMK